MKSRTLAPTSDLKPEVLAADNLQKAYGKRQALWGLTFSLRAGRIMGFLGPNGAGKTTSIRILTTMLEPDAGKYTVDGIRSNYPKEIRRRIGVLPENLGFPRQMTGIEYLTYYAQLYGRTPTKARDRAMLLLEEVGMSKRANSLIGGFSHGMRQRMGIARSLINDPTVVFFDEPTLGLDPRGQQELLQLIRRIASERGAGVILCSHVLSEVESVCDDVLILNQGEIVASGTVSEVIGRVESNILLKNAARIMIPVTSLTKARQILKGMPNIKKITRIGEEGWLQILFVEPSNEDSSKTYLVNNNILDALIHADIPIMGFEVEGSKFKLQDVFMRLTEETIV